MTHFIERATDWLFTQGSLTIFCIVCLVLFWWKGIPWLNGVVKAHLANTEKALEESRLSRKQRDVQTEIEVGEKAELHLTCRKVADTGMLLAGEVKALREEYQTARAEVVGHVLKIDGKVEGIQRDVRRLLPRRGAEHHDELSEMPAQLG